MSDSGTGDCHMPAKKRKLPAVAGTVIALIVLFGVIRTEPARRVLAKSSMYVGAYEGMRRDVAKIRVRLKQREDRARIRAYLNEHEVRKLQLGAGASQAEGWLNTDVDLTKAVVYLDAAEPLPFEDGAFRYVFSEHMIEHLRYEDGESMLREAYRILEPGGRIRIATPNLLRLVALFGGDKTAEMRRYLEGKPEWHGWPKDPTPECFILNYEISTFGHHFVYDPATLEAAMERAGFTSIEQWAPGESNDPNLRAMEIRRDDELNDYETMVMEGVKP